MIDDNGDTFSTPTKVPTFKNPSGARYLKALFYEQTMGDKSTVVYTLKDEDHKGFPSLYRLYMEADDLTEWKFATTHLDGWEHWEMLTECTWFKPYVARWRRELELRTRSHALARVIREAKSGGKESFSANRLLISGAYTGKETPSHGRGRPSKQEIKDAAYEIASDKTRMEDDLLRITKPN